jgi:hypothetical protein
MRSTEQLTFQGFETPVLSSAISLSLDNLKFKLLFALPSSNTSLVYAFRSFNLHQLLFVNATHFITFQHWCLRGSRTIQTANQCKLSITNTCLLSAIPAAIFRFTDIHYVPLIKLKVRYQNKPPTIIWQCVCILYIPSSMHCPFISCSPLSTVLRESPYNQPTNQQLIE